MFYTMLRNHYICMLLTVTLAAIASPTATAQGIKGRELLGLRLGGLLTSGELDTIFGSGTEMEVYFVEGFAQWFGISISLSSHNFGESKSVEKNIEFTGLNRGVELRIYSLTAGLYATRPFTRRLYGSVETGFGLYTITAAIPGFFFEGSLTDNQFGVYGGAGFQYRVGKQLRLELHGKYHYVFSGSGDEHPAYFFSGSNRTDIYQITLGVTFLTR